MRPTYTMKYILPYLESIDFFFSFFLISFIFISWRLITLQYCSGFCHTLTWISHGFTCIPHPDLPSLLPLHLIPLGLPSAPGLSTYWMHETSPLILMLTSSKITLTGTSRVMSEQILGHRDSDRLIPKIKHHTLH